ncbi:hypothetical protein PUN28_004979 [Cardiocondyla obscurior]|uniref:DNA-directed RNA polymerase I subunit RPA43 n=1 Tax=Cardiocondyla obscurior TaxID=286306 RepID=A0AAW2GDW6_9HYME
MTSQNHEVSWSDLELAELLEDEESHVHFARTVKHLALHPYHLNNVQRGLNQILKSSLNSYDKELKGFVLAFKNPKLLSNFGETLYDSPFIHIDIEADFYLFRPTIGSFLKGVVKKKGLDHIVLLVHKVYTVSIPKPDDIEEWTGESVEIDQQVKCCINHIDNRSKPPFIRATLNSDYSQGCRLPDSINKIDNVDSTIESMSSSIKIEALTNGMSEDDSVSEKEKKKHRKKHKKSRESSSSICKVESESESTDNLGNIISKSIDYEKKPKYQNVQDTILNSDESLNNSAINNISKKHKRSRKKSLSDDTTLDEHITLHKAVKRENSIPLDTEPETKKRKKHTKKSKETDSELQNEEKIINTENPVSRRIKSEKIEHMTLNSNDLFSSNLEESAPKKHKKNKKVYMKMSESDSEEHVVKIKIEKPDPLIDDNTQVTQNLKETLEISKIVKKEISIEYDSFEKEGKKSPKKNTLKDSPSKSVKIKSENVINNVDDISEKEKKKSSKKHMPRDSECEIKIKSENITSNINNISRTTKREPEGSQNIKYNISATDSNLNDLDHDNVSKKSKKKKSTILSDLELKYPVKIEKNVN